MSRQSLQQNIQWSAEYYRKKKYHKIFSDQLTMTERRNITEYTRTGKKISDKPTKTETRNITEYTRTGIKIFSDQLTITERRNITEYTRTGKKFSDKPRKTETSNITEPTITRLTFLVTRRLLQKKETLLNRQSPDKNV